ncbi:MAG: thioredoxin domain-containing protein [Thermodesulfobacteriota bacterium]
MTEKTPPNRLARETSPYLRQHADNPVDWYPWGPEALDRARREDKPIFLSIGYSTCHWCHVMAHESFANPAIAALMNEHFINIKVDREERPDLDETYMTAVQLLAGTGGWPMSVFLTPDLKPFYAGTYFPPEDRGGFTGFPRLLLALNQIYRQNREKLVDLSEKVTEQLKILAARPGAAPELTQAQVAAAAQRLKEDSDRRHGGFGGAPKFPRALELGFLLNQARSQKDAGAQEIVGFSLEKMARGGIYDQVGGGFHRYTVDGVWLVPHFEKMLYDNALLTPLYLALFQLTGREFSRRIAKETLDFVLRELAAPQGGFYAALDAESDGEEGKFYLWSREELEKVVGPELAPLARVALGVTAGGNFEGKNILTRPFSLNDLATRFSQPREQLEGQLHLARERLGQARATRVRPHRDGKIITSWNGLMISALALGAQVLGEDKYYAAAAKAARFILTDLFREDGLYRIWAAGQVSIPGFLEDYAFLANACLDLYETDFDPAWLAMAKRLADLMESRFLDPEDGTYFYVAQNQEATLVRSKNVYDQAIPSGNSMAARVCLRLHRCTEQEAYQERAKAILSRFQPQAAENPWGFAHLLTVLDLYLTPPVELTLVGDPQHPRMREMLKIIYGHFLPARRLLRKNPADCAALEELAPAVRYLTPQEEGPTAYLCHNFTCRPGITDPQDLAEQLAGLS